MLAAVPVFYLFQICGDFLLTYSLSAFHIVAGKAYNKIIKKQKEHEIMAKTIITAALTGAVTPAGYDIPETPQQIADCAYECWKAGAAVVHLHMRDDNGAGVMDPAKFYETIKLIRAHKDCDVIVNCTSSGDNRVADDSPYGNAMRVLHHK